ncbi:MAG: hypothetical protein J1F35_01685 [Erysipelotrichales bacterium]|nr:hypothetical protein [Erysipelotrichales bacterium]
MEQLIDKKYNIDNLVQLRFAVGDVSLVCDATEILFLKLNDKVVVNKYLNHPKRYLFPLSDEPVSKVDEHTLYNFLFELDKDHIVYEGHPDKNAGLLFQLNFQKAAAGIKYSHVMLEPEELNPTPEMVNIDKIDSFFDFNQYDSLYIFTNDGNLYLSHNNNDSTNDRIPFGGMIEFETIEELSKFLPLTMVASKDGKYEIKDVVYLPVNSEEYALVERKYNLTEFNNTLSGDISNVPDSASNSPKL